MSQIVLTAENDFEKDVLKRVEDKDFATRIFNGTFNRCGGGWTRFYPRTQGMYGDGDVESLIIRIEKPEESK